MQAVVALAFLAVASATTIIGTNIPSDIFNPALKTISNFGDEDMMMHMQHEALNRKFWKNILTGNQELLNDAAVMPVHAMGGGLNVVDTIVPFSAAPGLAHSFPAVKSGAYHLVKADFPFFTVAPATAAVDTDNIAAIDDIYGRSHFMANPLMKALNPAAFATHDAFATPAVARSHIAHTAGLGGAVPLVRGMPLGAVDNAALGIHAHAAGVPLVRFAGATPAAAADDHFMFANPASAAFVPSGISQVRAAGAPGGLGFAAPVDHATVAFIPAGAGLHAIPALRAAFPGLTFSSVADPTTGLGFAPVPTLPAVPSPALLKSGLTTADAAGFIAPDGSFIPSGFAPLAATAGVIPTAKTWIKF